ncbi:Rieske 2Fe-2S domain-containing protein [Chamaesiphon sp. OTE_20_metabat_361]|uniref:QcrA and Rieske domain-containing protein n=1 Tax=Chamaesiphon sp. OTE_20_metabat_361 TaxID=2964689 RepID=UPI00286B4C49|nr:Rieske 2Fe-2S domain-containing protein [Chamaesiphon sp. OTE_20_metabat_361]
MLKRRSFLGYFSIGWLTACFPVVLAACAPNKADTQATKQTDSPVSDDKSASAKTTEGFKVVGSTAQLEKMGSLQIAGVAVARDPANSKKLVAVNSKCTHTGCEVKWLAGEKRYRCPCHDAEFAADGKVLNGPAPSPLATYPVKVVGTQVLVKV